MIASAIDVILDLVLVKKTVLNVVLHVVDEHYETNFFLFVLEWCVIIVNTSRI